MTPQALLDHFKTAAAAARALKLKQPSISEWIEKGAIPIDRQCQIEIITGGALIADRALLPEIPVGAEVVGAQAAA